MICYISVIVGGGEHTGAVAPGAKLGGIKFQKKKSYYSSDQRVRCSLDMVGQLHFWNLPRQVATAVWEVASTPTHTLGWLSWSTYPKPAVLATAGPALPCTPLTAVAHSGPPTPPAQCSVQGLLVSIPLPASQEFHISLIQLEGEPRSPWYLLPIHVWWGQHIMLNAAAPQAKMHQDGSAATAHNHDFSMAHSHDLPGVMPKRIWGETCRLIPAPPSHQP